MGHLPMVSFGVSNYVPPLDTYREPLFTIVASYQPLLTVISTCQTSLAIINHYIIIHH